MARQSLVRACGVLSALLLLASAGQGALADTFIGGTNAWTMVGAPTFARSFGNPVALLTYSNHLGVNVTGIVIMVLRDNSTRLVYFSTSTVTIPAGGLGTLQMVEFGQAAGTYHASFFAFTFGGVALSQTNSTLFSVGQ